MKMTRQAAYQHALNMAEAVLKPYSSETLLKAASDLEPAVLSMCDKGNSDGLIAAVSAMVGLMVIVERREQEKELASK